MDFVHAAVTERELKGEACDQPMSVAAAGGVTSFVRLMLPEGVEFPAASEMTAVSTRAPAASPVVLIVAEKVVPLQVAPAPLAEPSTLIVTDWLASLQVPLTVNVAESLAELM